ncbi:MAG: MFS transporter [Rhodospirillaceae bacterium]|jgi:predicted MFS family arabinose efflux permease|nr:MFS transporter [Rhodospirillales bacterium]MBT3906482.1 MFS transporter [Rhodospirillaceae bacterium]MBT4700756.1 MFS transporter [Rhodospirillaceae bacterium]MBT5034043.1 MFS transporter [Rhodospirillaceae bacterium]MBT6218829.1 MFS transporter [Rhodospirillaceae bacterium]
MVLFILATIGFMVSAVLRIADTVLPQIATTFQVSIGDTAMVITAFAIVYGMFQLIHGGLGDHFGKLKVVFISSILGGSATYLCAYAESLAMLSFFRALSGAAMAASVPLSLAYIADTVAYENRQTEMARYMSGIMIGHVFGVAVGGIVADWIGWRDLFRVFGGLTILSGGVLGYAIYTRRAPPEINNGAQIRLSNYTSLLNSKSFRHIFIVYFVEGIALFGAIGFASALMRDRFDLSYTHIGLLLSGFGIGGLMFSLSVKRLLKLFSQFQFLIFGGVLSCGAYLSLAYIQAPMGLFPIFLILGLGFYMFHLTLQTHATVVSPRTQGTSMALFSLAIFTGTSVGAQIFGYLIDNFSFIHAFVTAGVIMIMVTLWYSRHAIKQA